MQQPFVIIADTREQCPYLFHAETLKIAQAPEVERGTLKTGDYSVKGLEDRICIERKSLADLFGSCGKGRDRFEREFERMQAFDYAALVVEVDWRSIYKSPPARSRLSPKNVLRTLLAWHMRYGVHIWPCPGRAFAEKITYLLLDRFYRDQIKAGCHDQAKN